MIRVRDLSVSFGQGARARPVLRDVGFEAARGETVGIVGESGCGKSTLLRSLAGSQDGWTGSIELHGRPVARRRRREDLREAQMVFQDPFGSLHPRHRIGRILSEPLRSLGLGDGSDRIAAALETVGLPVSFADRFPHQLSGGQRQRVAIARALIVDPSILFLDEPTSALDVSIQAEILNLLADLKEERNLTMVFVSHDLAVVAHMCERALVMQDGRIVDELTSEDMRRGVGHTECSRELLAAGAA